MKDNDKIWLATLKAIPGYPWLPCPICNNGEGCVHPAPERARAAFPNLQLPKYIGEEIQYDSAKAN